jgi:isocitrate dehydrogenase (NAD+)
MEMAQSVKEIFLAAKVPVHWEQFDLTGHSKTSDSTLLEQAMTSIRKNKIALKGMLNIISRFMLGVSLLESI